MSKKKIKISNQPNAEQQALKIGDDVIVLRDNGTEHQGKVRAEPWLLSGHTWVAMVTGIAGAYDLTRFRRVTAEVVPNGE